MRRLQQTSILQTGTAIFRNHLGEEIQVPLFSSQPMLEDQEVSQTLEDKYTLEHVFYTNCMRGSKCTISKEIKKFINRNGFLPLDLMESLKSGFSNVTGEYRQMIYPNICYY